MLAETTAAMYERPPSGGLFLPETTKIALLQAPATTIETGVTKGVALADNAAKHLLGTFDSLCLNCGFLLMDEADEEPAAPSE